MTLIDFIPHIAFAGFSIAILSNIILIFGRKPGLSVIDALSSPHLDKSAREKKFRPIAIKIAVPLAYFGVGLFLLAIAMVVAIGIAQVFG